MKQIIKIMLHIGHSLTHSTVSDALRLIHKLGGNSIQIALGELESKIVRSIDEEDASMALKIRDKHGFYVVVHGKFLYNFCRPLSTAGWQRTMLIKELSEANKVSADVIIHQGKNVAEIKLSLEEALQNYVDNIVIVLESSSTKNKIILENSARQGTELGYSLDELYIIYSMIPEKHRDRIAFCLDLCHCFVAGELDVRSKAATEAWFKKFERLFGLGKLAVLHFNDSAIQFNGANDNHDAICNGYIGNKIYGGSTEGFQYVVQYCLKNSIPVILETPSKDMTKEMSLVRTWACY